MTIKFQTQKYTDDNNTEIYGIEIYRQHMDKWGYVDMLHPMSIKDLIELKKFLQELISLDNDRN